MQGHLFNFYRTAVTYAVTIITPDNNYPALCLANGCHSMCDMHYSRSYTVLTCFTHPPDRGGLPHTTRKSSMVVFVAVVAMMRLPIANKCATSAGAIFYSSHAQLLCNYVSSVHMLNDWKAPSSKGLTRLTKIRYIYIHIGILKFEHFSNYYVVNDCCLCCVFFFFSFFLFSICRHRVRGGALLGIRLP